MVLFVIWAGHVTDYVKELDQKLNCRVKFFIENWIFLRFDLFVHLPIKKFKIYKLQTCSNVWNINAEWYFFNLKLLRIWWFLSFLAKILPSGWCSRSKQVFDSILLLLCFKLRFSFVICLLFKAVVVLLCLQSLNLNHKAWKLEKVVIVKICSVLQWTLLDLNKYFINQRVIGVVEHVVCKVLHYL